MSETYPYEQLDGRRFQRLVQSLVTAEHRDVQCFPISGPDGGRDVVVMSRHGDEERFSDSLIYQVKFREPNPHGTPTSDDLFNWVVKNLRREISKIETLATRGAKEFCFVSNVAASGHLDSGLRDRVQKWANDNIKIAATFWWREDLDARLERSQDLIFRFQLFRGPDAVRAFFEEALSPESSKSSIRNSKRSPSAAAMMLYLAQQYEEQATLRFKQADLDAMPVLEFFVDVPAKLQPAANLANDKARYYSFLEHQLSRENEAASPSVNPGDLVISQTDRQRELAGGAQLLLNEGFAEKFNRVVIEGAPGQGKSTLIQYLGQINRARLLNKIDDLKLVPSALRDGAARLPLRVELRHLATWLQGRNPWSEEPISGVQSVESFIAAHITYATGGMSFTPDDLASIATATPMLVMLDGLDEVADIEIRKNVVRLSDEFVKRLSTVGADMQVVITSRPSSFSKSPIFSRTDFSYLQLVDLTPRLIQHYTDAWIERRKIPTLESRSFRAVLRGSLSQPHMADLSRNPMQLAILLWLVYVKSWSLPDKRTALYEAYMTTFLDREADKSPIVRQHREMLLELHGYIGWVLHSRSEDEAGQGAGDIALDDLKALMLEYLLREEGPVDLAEQLFEGVQRVFVLVERIEGRFEFEVQPLREFFAARYLYKTAPHYTNATPVYGSRPDRLEALIRNPYWLNVARFFCGWYDKGELADLSRRLEDLCADDEFRYLDHPKDLIRRLLGDYVTTASKRDMRQLAGQLVDPLTFRLLQRRMFSWHGSEFGKQILPEDQGLPILIDQARERLRTCEAGEIVHETGIFLATQDDPDRLSEWWLGSTPQQNDAELVEWVRRGSISQSLLAVSTSDLVAIISHISESANTWGSLVESGRLDVAFSGSILADGYLQAVKDGHFVRSAPHNSFGDLARRVDNVLQAGVYDPRWQHFFRSSRPSESILSTVSVEIHDQAEVLEKLSSWFEKRETRRWSRNSFLAAGAAETRAVLGDCWAAWRLALFSVLSTRGRGQAIGFHDDRFSLADRASASRKYSSDLGYWQEIFGHPIPKESRVATLAATSSWASVEVLSRLSSPIAAAWESLSPQEVSQIWRFARAASTKHSSGNVNGKLKISEGDYEALPLASVPCMSVALEPRMGERTVQGIYERFQGLALCSNHGSIDAAFRINSEAKLMGMTTREWDSRAERVKNLFTDARPEILLDSFKRGINMTAKQAISILEIPDAYPLAIVTAAESALATHVMAKIPSLQSTARSNRWFETLDY